VWGEFDSFAGILPIAGDRYTSKVHPQFAGVRRSSITRMARSDETRSDRRRPRRPAARTARPLLLIGEGRSGIRRLAIGKKLLRRHRS
jgi:hypothetical protein